MDDAARWNARYQDLLSGEQTIADLVFEPPSALRRCDMFLPQSGVAVDLAGGNGGAAIWLAGRGLHPVLVEGSDVAIDQAKAAAERVDLCIDALQLDLSEATVASAIEKVEALPGAQVGERGPIALVCCFHYLQRDLLASVADGLPPGAIFMAAIATVTNRERNDHPSPRFLLEPGELAELVLGDASDGADRFDVLHSHEGWNDGDHHEAELVIRRR